MEDQHLTTSLAAAASAPANVALIKYWGKKNFQEGANPSLSLTLNEMRAFAQIRKSPAPPAAPEGLQLDLKINQQTSGPDLERVRQWWQRLAAQEAFFAQGHFTVESCLNFPAKTGLASSAAGFAALAAAAWAVQAKSLGKPVPAQAADLPPSAQQTISRWARWGSGSAARSILGPAMLWGTTQGWANSSDDYAIVAPAAAYWASWHDGVVITDPHPKKISSRQGHALMQKHWAAAARYAQARQNLANLLSAAHQGQDPVVLKIIAQEAWTLIALMMTSDPPYTLINPTTLAVMNAVQIWQAEAKLPVTFTIDAGANLHILCRENVWPQVAAHMQQDLKSWDVTMRSDQVGPGAQLFSDPAALQELAASLGR